MLHLSICETCFAFQDAIKDTPLISDAVFCHRQTAVKFQQMRIAYTVHPKTKTFTRGNPFLDMIFSLYNQYIYICKDTENVSIKTPENYNMFG